MKGRVHRILAGLVVLIAVLAAVALVMFSGGFYDDYPRTALLRPAQQRSAPAWTQPCWPTARWTDRPVCVHVTGRVVWIQKHDPDGDGDRHLLVIDRLRPRIVKLERTLDVPHLPRLGSRVDAVGWLMKGASGRDEINTQRFSAGGHTATTQSG